MQTETTAPPAAAPAKQRAGLFEIVTGDDGTQYKVYPLSVRAMKAHRSAVVSLLAAGVVCHEHWAGIRKSANLAASAYALMAPHVGPDMFELAAASCVPDPIELETPIDTMATIVQKWIEQTFLPVEKKLKNILALVDVVTLAATGAQVSFWRTALQSLSPAASPTPTSSTQANAATADRTAVGVGPNSEKPETPPGDGASGAIGS